MSQSNKKQNNISISQQSNNNNREKDIKIIQGNQQNMIIDEQKVQQEQQQQLIEIGLFTVNITKMKQHYNKSQISRILKQLQLSSASKCNKIFQYIPERSLPYIQQFQGNYQIQFVHVNWRKHKKFGKERLKKCLQDVAHIVFTKLQQLNLRYCHLTNIQIVSFINTPQLQILYLSINEITNPKPLIKSDFPNLWQVRLTSINFRRTQNLYRWNLPQLQRFYIDVSSYEKNIFSKKLNKRISKQILMFSIAYHHSI